MRTTEAPNISEPADVHFSTFCGHRCPRSLRHGCCSEMRARDGGKGHVQLLRTQGTRCGPGQTQNHILDSTALTLSSPCTSCGHFALRCGDILLFPALATLRQAAGREEPASPRCPLAPARSAVHPRCLAPHRLPNSEPAPAPRNNPGSSDSTKERFPGRFCNFAESHSANGRLEMLHSSLAVAAPRCHRQV